MDDELDYGDEQPQQQQPSWTQVAQSLPFDESARQQLGRYQGAMGWVQDQVHDGNLYPHEGEQYAQQLMQRIGPLVQRQQQTEQLAKQKQAEDAMHAAALGHTIEMEHQKNFMAQVPHLTQMLPTEHGPVMLAPQGVQQLDVPEKPEAGEPADLAQKIDVGELAPVVGGGVPLAPDGQPFGEQPRTRDVTDENGVVHHQRIPSAAERQAFMAAHPGGMSVQNGPYTDQYQDGQRVGTDRPQSGGQPQPAVSAARQKAVAEMGTPRPQEMMWNGRRWVDNPQAKSWDAGVNARTARIEHEEAQYHARTLGDAFTHAGKAVNEEAADPATARLAAVVEHLGMHDPSHPRLAEMKAQLAGRSAGLAAKDPAGMTMGELATAAYGPHTNVSQLVKAEADKIAKDETPVPAGTKFGDTTYNPPGYEGAPGVWKNVDPDHRFAEANRRVRSMLTAQVNDTRAARQKGSQSAGGASTAAPKPAGGGEGTGGGGEGGAKAPPGGPGAGPTPAPKVEPLPPGKATLADVLEEKKRRERAKVAAQGGYAGPDLAGGLNTSLLGGP